ncbi:MAG TPA: hypothetical protein VIQ00_00385, partial [Chitinophagaceae bacterium]
MRLPSFQSFTTNAAATFKRFPLAVTAAIVASLFCILFTHLPYDLQESYHYYWNIIMSCYLGMLLFISISIYSERKKFKSVITTLLNVGGLVIIVAYYFSLPPQFMVISFTRFLLFALVLHLLIAFLPFLDRNEVNGFWQYNKIIFIRILTAALYTTVLY